MQLFMQRFIEDEQGQDLVEFALLLAFALFGVIAVGGGFQFSMKGVGSSMSNTLAAADAATQWARTVHFGGSPR